MVADLYIAWAHYFDAVDDFQQTEKIYRKGLDARAQPYEELAQAHQNFSVSVSQRIIYNDEESKKKFQASMEEKRSALTLLRAHKKKTVGSVRTGFAVLNENPGKYESAEGSESKNQVPIKIHEDDGTNQPGVSGSIMRRNVADLKKKNENFLEPGPWSKVKVKLDVVPSSSKPDFEIMEDDSLIVPIECKNKLYELGAQLPKDFVSSNKPQKSSVDFPMIVDDPVQPNVIPFYDKFDAYPNSHTEISPEELRGFRWFVKKKMLNAPVVRQYSELLMNSFECGPRLFPGFVKSSVSSEKEVKYSTDLEPLVVANIQLPMEIIYENGYEVSSMEEILAERFYRGGIKILSSDDFEDIENDDMELTMAHEGRMSIHPLARKSLVPRKSILRKSFVPKPIIAEEEEEEQFDEKPKNVRFEGIESTNESSNIQAPLSPIDEQRMSLKRKLTTPDKSVDVKNRLVSETPPAPAREEVFKPPLPPTQQIEVRKSIRPFEILDDEETFCSTQKFNMFVKASSISTPNNVKKTPNLAQMKPIPLQFSPEKASPPQESKVSSESEESPGTEKPQQTAVPKQLSTIM